MRPRYGDGEWIFGGWWDFNKWQVPVQPDRAGLDAVCPRNPVALTSADGHTVWANSQALQLLGVPDDAGSRGPWNSSTTNAANHGVRKTPVYPVRKLAASGVSGNLPDGLREAQRYLLSLGLTGVHDIDGADALDAYRALRAEGVLALRVHKLLAQDDLEASIGAGIRTGQGNRWIRHGAVKIFADGAAGSTAYPHMTEPFPGGTSHGMEVTAYPDLLGLANRAAAAGIAVAVHAIGDRANHLVLNALAEIRDTTAGSACVTGSSTPSFCSPRMFPRLAALGVVASMQPSTAPATCPSLAWWRAGAWHPTPGGACWMPSRRLRLGLPRGTSQPVPRASRRPHADNG